MNHTRIFHYIGIAAIVLLLLGLVGWYLFLRQQTSLITSTASGRGFSVGIPSFSSSRGSTSANSETERGVDTGTQNTSEGNQGESTPSGSGARGDSRSAFLRFLGIGRGELLPTNDQAQDFGAPGETMPVAGETAEQLAPRLFRVSAAPVAGAAFLSSTTPSLRYVERSTGYVFDVNPQTGVAVRRTNTLIPKVYEARIGGSGTIIGKTLVSSRGLTLGARISTTTRDGLAELQTVNLGEIRDTATLTSSPDILTLRTEGDKTQLLRSSWNGSKPNKIITLAGGDFRILWPSDTRIALVEKAASGVPGNVFAIDTTLRPLMKAEPGLTAILSATGALLYGSDDGRRLQLFMRGSASSTAIEIPLATIADKCVWAPNSQTAYCAVPALVEVPFLDQWYRGQIHPVDTWYTIHAGGGNPERLFASESSPIDVENPLIDASGKYLAFTNAFDKSLWILRITE